jgi:hypothetical protein
MVAGTSRDDADDAIAAMDKVLEFARPQLTADRKG